jgi:PleD family two-component response regulator
MEQLVMCADAALYEAKRAGRDCIAVYAGDATSEDLVAPR